MFGRGARSCADPAQATSTHRLVRSRPHQISAEPLGPHQREPCSGARAPASSGGPVGHQRHRQRAQNGARDEVGAEVQGLPDDHRRFPHRQRAKGPAPSASRAPRSRPFANPAVAIIDDTIIPDLLPPYGASCAPLPVAFSARGLRIRAISDDMAGSDAGRAFKRGEPPRYLASRTRAISPLDTRPPLSRRSRAPA